MLRLMYRKDTPVAAMPLALFLPVMPLFAHERPSWSRNESGAVVYGFPDSDVIFFMMVCRKGKIEIDVEMRPESLQPNERITVTFGAGGRTLRRVAVAPEPDGENGETVTLTENASDPLFDLFSGSKQLEVITGQERMHLPLNGAAPLVARLRRECARTAS